MTELRSPRAGQPITESFLREVVKRVTARLMGGDGIMVENRAGAIIIRSAAQTTGGKTPTWQPYNGA